MKGLVFVDIETTSLNRLKAGLLNIGAVHFPSKQTFEVNCSPYSVFDRFDGEQSIEIDPKSMEFNGLHSNLTLNKFAWEAVEDFIKWCAQFTNGVQLGGHNISQFDAIILNRQVDKTMSFNWLLGYRFFDVASLGYLMFGEMVSCDDLCRKLGLELEPKPHNSGLSGALKESEIYEALRSELQFQTWKS